MKILVTGGAGFIGSHVVEAWQGKADVVVLDDLRTGHAKNLEGLDCRWIRGSVCDRSAVEAAVEGADCVVHLAALVSVPESMERPREAVDINVTGLLNVLEAAKAAKVKRLVFASSAAVYGENPQQPKVETLIPDPRSPYAITKLDGEYYCDLYAREGWLSTACLRFFNVFGPRQDPRSPYAAAVPIFFEKAVAGEPITIHGDGGQTRDFIYVEDIVAAISFLSESAVEGVFNAGYGSAMTILELVETIRRLTGSSSPVVHAGPRAGDIRHSTSDPGKLRRAGWNPTYSAKEGLQKFLEKSLNRALHA
jgi:UDP-glucose 4-epimerase